MKMPADPQINRINPNKLLLSKWTSVTPLHKEKHFLVIRVERDEREFVTVCHLEAVLTHNQYTLAWRELKDKTRWLAGWR